MYNFTLWHYSFVNFSENYEKDILKCILTYCRRLDISHSTILIILFCRKIAKDYLIAYDLPFYLYVRDIDTIFYLYIGIPLALLIHIGWKLIQQMSDIYFSWTEFMVMFKLRFGLNGCAMIWSGPSYCGLDTRCRHLTPNFYLSCLCLSQINSV